MNVSIIGDRMYNWRWTQNDIKEKARKLGKKFPEINSALICIDHRPKGEEVDVFVFCKDFCIDERVFDADLERAIDQALGGIWWQLLDLKSTSVSWSDEKGQQRVSKKNGENYEIS